MNEKFGNYLDRLSPTLRRITYRLNGHFTYFDHDDLFQEAVEYLWQTFRNGKLEDKTDSYMLQGCYFHLRNYVRTMADKATFVRLDHGTADEEPGLGDIIAAADEHISDMIDAKAILDLANKEGLSDKESAVLSLCMDGLTMREIGQRIGASHVMVIKIKRRLRDKLSFLRS